MPKVTRIVSQFHNLPTGDLVDQLGGLKAAIADLQKRQKALRDELLSRAVKQVEGRTVGRHGHPIPSGGRSIPEP